MNWRRLVSIVFGAALLAGCSGSSSALGTAHEVGVSKLRQELQVLAPTPHEWRPYRSGQGGRGTTGAIDHA
jgi:hypothetical protein